jgi:hypothetical protein
MRRRSPIEVTPSYKILLINMPPHIDRDDLNIVLARQNFHPVDIRVIRKNVAGDVRVFGFIDFADAQLAKEWFDYNQGLLKFEDGSQAKLEYSREPDHPNQERRHNEPRPLTDWTCAKVDFGILRRLIFLVYHKQF